MLRRLLLLTALQLLVLVHAQITSVTDASGNTIVETILTPVGGAPVTSILSTIPAAPALTSTTDPGAAPTTASATTSTSSPTSTASLTQPTIQQGPVGQPASTSVTPGAPIPYIYTTVVNGVQTVIQDTFTPTSPSTVSVPILSTGSIMAFSDFTSLFGAVPTSSANSLLRCSTWVVLAASVIPLIQYLYA